MNAIRTSIACCIFYCFFATYCCANESTYDDGFGDLLGKLDDEFKDMPVKVRFMNASSTGHVIGVLWRRNEQPLNLFIWHPTRGLTYLTLCPKGQVELGKAPRPSEYENKIAFVSGNRYLLLRQSLKDVLEVFIALKIDESHDMVLAFTTLGSWIGIKIHKIDGKGQIKIAKSGLIFSFKGIRRIVYSPQIIEEHCEMLAPMAGEISELFLGHRGLSFLTSDNKSVGIKLNNSEAEKNLGGVVDSNGFHRFDIRGLLVKSQLDSRIQDIDIPNNPSDIAAAFANAHEEKDRYKRRDPLVWLFGPSTKAP